VTAIMMPTTMPASMTSRKTIINAPIIGLASRQFHSRKASDVVLI
jgi:hypothetical protein